MTRFVHRVAAAALLPFLLPAVSALGSPMSDFQARLGQTRWNFQTVEQQIRSLPLSSNEVAVPEALASHLGLLSENVVALTACASARWTNEQKRSVAEGVKSAAEHLRDLSAMAAHRGLAAAVSGLSALEWSCRAAATAL